MSLDTQYQQVLQPDNFVKEFESMKIFESWCEMSSIGELQECLEIFSEFELYEHSTIIYRVIKKKYEIKRG